MAYNKTTWKAGDVVTSAKLNNIENGIANAAEVVETASGNVFDKTDIILGSIFMPWDGEITEWGGTFCSYIPIEPGYYTFIMPYLIYTENAKRIPLFDENKVFVKEINGNMTNYDENNRLVTINISQSDITSDGCAYFGFSELYELLDTLMVMKGTTYPGTYVAPGTILTIPGLQIPVGQIVGFADNSNPLYGKIASFNGDSICYGAGATGGYATVIGQQNAMTIQNIAVSGGTIADVEGHHCISGTISDMRSDADYVILEGGVNDPDFGVTLGELTSDYDETLDDTTFAGAFETMLKNALTRFPGKKIGYVFVHKCGNFSTNHYNIAKQACEKWGIPYCDLNTKTPALGYIESLRTVYTYQGDGYHPNMDGYNAYYVPKITAWMKTL